MRATGTLEMHGVAVERDITGSMENAGSGGRIEAAFDVPCADHDIAIPKVVSENIAEVIGVTLNANLVAQ